ncbi:bifunctional diguanylate cyclase/phosphodiesterase [Selenomonas sp. oral taxon 138]|uniref:putative bifunctional diguanylate cyclase/phosphodiesterase n=1 Tax=Selenomonas sp. oral taxon 138 TaxID=712532 RepID=UPI0002A4511C|nr:bifunctional diguanylate cyclase/phosphodiesterase [Selenomonas sp. oral taxon 138]EKX98068.1 cyclic diguanylate phosphodiesterase domain protein [Selenomonas sp. oral taxon 138 str. F0429]
MSVDRGNGGLILQEQYGERDLCQVTGLLNMMQFMRHASAHLQDVLADPLTFMYFDIENFKSFNQRYGFQQGNRLLRYVADLLRETFEGNLVARFNDDHFAVATHSENPADCIQFIHERIRVYDLGLPMEVKAGIYHPPEDVTDVALIMDRAKIACNSIKNTYDLTWAEFDPAMEEEINFRSHIIRSFQEAMIEGYIEVFYQPEIRTMTREICGFEALARWRDPVHGMISPGVFVPVLEDAHLSPQLDLYIIERVCQDISRIRRELPSWELLRVSVNLSRADFRLMDMVQAVEDVRLRYDIARSLLNVEVTEGAQSDDEKFLQGEIARFRAAGYEVWMDDFGSGYSSLNNVKDYVFDVLKIDMNFLRSFDTNPKSAIVIRSIVNMAKELGLHTLAEGVETEAQFEFLHEIGCEKVQGYLFSPPMPLDKAIAYCHGETAQVKVEPLRLGSYYAEIGAINVLSSEAIERRGSPEIGDALSLAVLEEEGGEIRYLYQSRMFKMFLQSIELDEDSVHTPHYERRKRQNERMIARMMEEADRTGREVYTDFITRNSFNSVRLRLVTRDVDDTRAVFLMATVNISRFSPEAGSMQEALNQIVALYDRVDLFDLGSRKLTQLYRDVYEPNYTQEYGHFEELVAHYAEEKILPAEQKLFKKFYSEKHLRAVLEDKAGREEVAVLFYKRMPDDGRMLRLHHLVPFRLGQRDYVISCVQAINENIITAVTAALAEDT